MRYMYGVNSYETSWEGDFNLVGCFTKKEDADNFIKDKNVAYEKEYREYSKCNNCKVNTCSDEEELSFNYSSECNRADIKKDRNGLYCENEREYYDIESLSYSVVKIKILDK